MNNEYLDSLTKLARRRQLKLSKEQEMAIYRVYEKATEQYYEKFLESMGNGTMSSGIRLQYCRQMANELQDIVHKYSIEGADNGIRLAKDIMDSCYDEYGLGDTIYANAVKNICGAIKSNTVKALIAGDIYKDGKGLSSRIWMTVNRNYEAINEVIASCVAQQLSAVEMSNVLKDFMLPKYKRKTWDNARVKELLGPGYSSWNKDISYEALRLARTTLTHSATLAMKQSAKANPYFNKVIWHSVHAIGRTCEICRERDGQTYSLANLPFDHPNGLCWNEPVLDKSLDEMADELKDWVEGQPNEKLDTWWRNYGQFYTDNKPISSNKIKQETKPVSFKKRSPEWFDSEFSHMREALGEHWDNGIKDKIMSSPEFVQDWLINNQAKFKYLGKEQPGSFYSRKYKGINMDLDKDRTNSRGMYSTFFHEFGHQIDNEFNGEGKPTLSNNMKFYKALEKDYEDTLVKFGKGSKPAPFVRGKIRDAQREDGDISSGVQDIYSGLSNGEIVAGWCHSQEYWNRGNKAIEIASEAWAHMHSAYTNAERLEVMKKWFPTACEVFESIVKRNLKSL